MIQDKSPVTDKPAPRRIKAVGKHLAKGDPGGYWENRGYHHRGDPWKQERYE